MGSQREILVEQVASLVSERGPIIRLFCEGIEGLAWARNGCSPFQGYVVREARL